MAFWKFKNEEGYASRYQAVTAFISCSIGIFGSLLLSWVAIFGTVTIGKDGAFYIDIAQTFLDQDAAAAFQLFNWPWFSFLLGATHWLTGIPWRVVPTSGVRCLWRALARY